MIVDEKLVLEIKVVHPVHPSREAQPRVYLRLSSPPVGLSHNRDATRMSNGIARVVGAVVATPRVARQPSP
jgi:hypothetical protein